MFLSSADLPPKQVTPEAPSVREFKRRAEATDAQQNDEILLAYDTTEPWWDKEAGTWKLSKRFFVGSLDSHAKRFNSSPTPHAFEIIPPQTPCHPFFDIEIDPIPPGVDAQKWREILDEIAHQAALVLGCAASDMVIGDSSSATRLSAHALIPSVWLSGIDAAQNLAIRVVRATPELDRLNHMTDKYIFQREHVGEENPERPGTRIPTLPEAFFHPIDTGVYTPYRQFRMIGAVKAKLLGPTDDKNKKPSVAPGPLLVGPCGFTVKWLVAPPLPEDAKVADVVVPLDSVPLRPNCSALSGNNTKKRPFQGATPSAKRVVIETRAPPKQIVPYVGIDARCRTTATERKMELLSALCPIHKRFHRKCIPTVMETNDSWIFHCFHPEESGNPSVKKSRSGQHLRVERYWDTVDFFLNAAGTHQPDK